MARPSETLDIEVLHVIRSRAAVGRPISFLSGPGKDKRVKTAFGIPGHRSWVCAAIRRLEVRNLVVRQISRESYPVGYGGDKPIMGRLETLIPITT